MQISEKDKGYLWDIEDACKDILTFLENTSYEKFTEDKMKRFAVERQLLVIGEAANHLSTQCTNSYPEIPWSLIVGLRNIIAHEYGEILVDRIYKIARENVPELYEEISTILNN